MMHVSPTPNRHTHTHACLGESWRESICHGLLTLLSSYSQHSLPPPNSGCYYHCPDAKRAQQPSQRGQMFHVSCGGTTSNFSSSYPSWWLDKFSSPLSAIMKLHTSWFWHRNSQNGTSLDQKTSWMWLSLAEVIFHPPEMSICLPAIYGSPVDAWPEAPVLSTWVDVSKPNLPQTPRINITETAPWNSV